VDLSWHFAGPRGPIEVCIRRLDQGPPAIRRLRVASSQTAAVNVEVAEEGRLAARPEEAGAAARTITIPPMPLAELVGQQLSDRQRDPVFRESMALARVLAQSVLGG
jgi:hypothetical protein